MTGAAATLLTDQICGAASLGIVSHSDLSAGGKTEIPLSVETGSTRTVYAAAADESGNVIAYSNAVTFSLKKQDSDHNKIIRKLQ